MRRSILSLSLIVAVFAFVVQLPVGDMAMRVQEQLVAVSYCASPTNPQQTCFRLAESQSAKQLKRIGGAFLRIFRWQPTSQQQSSLGQERTSLIERLLGKDETTSVVVPKATLSCDEVGGKVQLRWSCPSDTTISRGFGTQGARFDTHGAGAGSVSSTLVSGTQYILQCIKGHQLHAEVKCTPPAVGSVGAGIATTGDPNTINPDIIPRDVTMR